MGDVADDAYESGEIAAQLDHQRGEFDSQSSWYPDEAFDGGFGADVTPPGGEPSASDLARDVTDRYMAVLTDAGHIGCPLSEVATISPQTATEPAAVVCGCGEFFPAPEFNDQQRELQPDEVSLDSPKAITVPAADPLARSIALIDATRIITPAEVESLIREAVNRLETGAALVVYWIRKVYERQHAYNQAFARAYNAAGGAVETRRQAAIAACEQEELELFEAKAMRDGVKDAMHNVRAALSGYQSTGNSVRSALEAGGSGRGR